VTRSLALSLCARPGEGGIRTRRIAVLVADGVDGEPVSAIYGALSEAGAVPRFVGTRLGQVESSNGTPIDVEVSMEAASGVLFDALLLADGEGAAQRLASDGHTLEFIKDQYRHCKPILALGAAAALLEAAGVPAGSSSDPGLLIMPAENPNAAAAAFIEAIARHRHFERETDPPRV
jgi:catalase